MDPIITSALTSFVTTMATNSSKVPMQTLDDLWYLAFGKLNHYVEKKKAEREISLTIYKNSIAEKIQKIKPENLQEPPLSVVGPALEASKYYIEEEVLRQMFANVISASMDKSKSLDVHHSFVEVIKQLSPDDALFLEEFKTTRRLPYGKVIVIENKSVKSEPSSKLDLEKLFDVKSKPFINYFYYSRTRNDWESNEFNISSLSRLGLIKIQEGVTLSNNLIYTEIEDEFTLLKKHRELVEGSKIVPNGFHLKIEKGTIDLSPFGISFFNTCV